MHELKIHKPCNNNAEVGATDTERARGKYCNDTTPWNRNKSNKASKGRQQSKNSFVLHGSGMLHKICTSKLDRSQSQKELWPIHLATQVIPKSLISLQPFQVQYHSKNTHASTLGKKRLRGLNWSPASLCPSYSTYYTGRLSKERTREQREENQLVGSA